MYKILIIFLFTLFITKLQGQNYIEIVNEAMDYVDQKNYSKAEQLLKEALRKEPSNPSNIMLFVNLGTIQRNLNKFEEALLSYNVAIEKYPEVKTIRISRALLYCDMDRFEEAMRDYNEILLLDPDDETALYHRGLLFLNVKNIFAAEEDFEKLIKLNPNNIDGKLGLAIVKKQRGEWEDAEILYNDIIKQNKMIGEVYYHRAECYLHLKKLARMNDDISKALELGYKEFPIFILCGQMRLAQFDKRLAKQDFLKAKELGADNEIIQNFINLCN